MDWLINWLTKDIKIDRIRLPPLLIIDASSRENPGEYPHKPSPETRVPGKHFCRWQYKGILIRFHMVVAETEAEKIYLNWQWKQILA